MSQPALRPAATPATLSDDEVVARVLAGDILADDAEVSVSSHQFHQNLDREVERVVVKHEVLRVQRDGGDFVVLSADDWRSIEETLYLNKVPGLADSLREAAREPLEEGTRLEDLDW